MFSCILTRSRIAKIHQCYSPWVRWVSWCLSQLGLGRHDLDSPLQWLPKWQLYDIVNLKYVDWLLLQHKYRVWLCQSLVCALLVSRLLWAYLTANMGTSGTRSVLNQTCISIVDQIVMLVLNGLIHAMPFMSSTDFCRPVLNRGSWLSIQAFRFRVNDWVSIITVTPPSSQYTVTPTESIGKWDDDEFDDKEEGK